MLRMHDASGERRSPAAGFSIGELLDLADEAQANGASDLAEWLISAIYAALDRQMHDAPPQR